jgi:hypothetical protein
MMSATLVSHNGWQEPRKENRTMESTESITLSREALRIIGSGCDFFSASSRVSSMIVRLHEIMSLECPALTVNEWMVICDALISTVLDTENSATDIARNMWAGVADADRLDGLGEKWNIDAQALSERLRDMSYLQQCAIIEVVSRFKQVDTSREWDCDQQMLEHCGARIR